MANMELFFMFQNQLLHAQLQKASLIKYLSKILTQREQKFF